MQIIQKNIKDLHAYERNNKKHPQNQLDTIKKSLIDYGRVNPVCIGKDGEIIAGHGRIEAVKQLIASGEKGWDTIPCVDKSDLTKSQIRKLRIIDNKSSEMAEWDIGNLKVELDELGDLELNDLFIEMDDLKLDLQTKQEAKEDDYIQPPTITTDIKRGDLMTFEKEGKVLHRLLCGDSTVKDDVERLMDGEKADMVFTDPPYGYKYESNHQTKHKELINDDKILEFIPNACLFSKDDIALYIFCGWQTIRERIDQTEKNKLSLKNVIIWKKNNWSMGDLKGAYAGQYEVILFCHKGRVELKEGRGQDIREFDRVPPKEHPTMKPVELIEKAINDTTEKGNIILDLFLGSGSTMVACHQLNRKCYGMELDEKYCQVICDRMKKLDPTFTIKKNGQEM